MATVLVAGCARTDPPARDGAGAIVEAGDLQAIQARVGDCYEDPDGSGGNGTLAAVPCTAPHDREVFHRFELVGDDYPGEAAVTEDAARVCLDAFAGYVGVPYLDQATLAAYPVVPSRQTWEDHDDRTVLCVLGREGSRLVGSQRDGARREAATT